MRIDLDCTEWADKAAAWEAVLAALAAPTWHGRNLDALLDGLRFELLVPARPLEVVISGQPLPGVRDLLLQMQEVFTFAREEDGEDVALTLPWLATARH